MAYVKSAKILIANLVQVKSTGHQTKQKFGFIKRVDKDERFKKLSKSFTVVIQPLSTRLIKPNFCFDLPHRRSTTVSLETRNPWTSGKSTHPVAR